MKKDVGGYREPLTLELAKEWEDQYDATAEELAQFQ